MSAVDDEPRLWCDCEDYACEGECCGLGVCSCSTATGGEDFPPLVVDENGFADRGLL